MELPLDGQPQRARIPRSWQLCVWVDADIGFWRHQVQRDTTVGRALTLTLALALALALAPALALALAPAPALIRTPSLTLALALALALL